LEENQDCLNNGASPTAVRTGGTVEQTIELEFGRLAQPDQTQIPIDGVALGNFQSTASAQY
jgi:hypothetical protein